MATHLKCLSLSPKGTYLAHSGIDGRLKIWSTENGILVHEYTPSSHLSTTCTCLVWSPIRNDHRTFKKKKRFISDEPEKLIIGIGTVTGSILFFDVLKGELHSEMLGGHSNVVNDISWHEETDSLFTCSNDQYIVEWALSSNKVKHKWKADRNSIYSICLVNENSLLSASSSIKWWDLKNRVVLKKFIGHTTEVFCLQYIGLPNGKTNEGNYFISSAVGDRVINVWQLGKENSSDSLVAFILIDEPVSLQVCSNACNDQNKVLLIVITSSGLLQIFEHHLNGKCKNPLKPMYTIQIAYEGGMETSRKTKSLPILMACFCLESDNEILIVYGNLLRPKFEKIRLTDCNTHTVLIREFSDSAFNTENGVDIYKQVIKPQKITHLVPGFMQPQVPGTTRKKRLLSESRNISCNELSLGDRIDMITKPHHNELSSALSTNTMVEVLIQGLQSNDKDLLNRVFDCNQEVMNQTIRILPVPSIWPLLKQLQHRLQTPTFANRLKYLKWLKTILLFHTAHVSKCQELEDMLVPFSHLLASRSESFQKLLQLKGTLNLILSQMELGKKDEMSKISAEPLILYQEESSDEEEIDLMSSHSESDNNWVKMEVEKYGDSSINSDDDN